MRGRPVTRHQSATVLEKLTREHRILFLSLSAAAGIAIAVLGMGIVFLFIGGK